MKDMILTITLHVIFFISVFDIYFKSPVVPITKITSKSTEAHAKRLVLFVEDGLRADSLFNEHNNANDWFLLRIKQQGTYGYSNTAVPTESRPGHVAIIAGFNEDPSAITKGWKANPVDFDSVLNQSRYTWSWGSPDILPIFSAGNNHIERFMYGADLEDFSASNSSIVDAWVLDEFEKFLRKSKNDPAVLEKLHSDKIVFFFHYLGTDTAGHAFKPRSVEYFNAIKTVDRIVERTWTLIETFYKDSNTAYVFTSDHGMTFWGSHGAGSNAETETPIIAWGAGIGKGFMNISQVDIAPLMAVVLGVDIPVNSMGIFPERIFASKESRLRGCLKNLRQLRDQFNTKKRMYEKWFLGSFMDLDFNSPKLDSQIEGCKRHVRLTLDGIRFYDRYYQTLYLIVVSSAIFPSILRNVLMAISSTSFNMEKSGKLTATTKMWIIITVLLNVIVYLIDIPKPFIVYITTSSFCWWQFFRIFKHFSSTLRRFDLVFFVHLFLLVLLTEMLVYSFFNRAILSVIQIVVVVIVGYEFKKSRGIFTWVLSSAIVSTFPIAPVVDKSNLNVLFPSCTLLLLFFLWIIRFDRFNVHSLALINAGISLFIKIITTYTNVLLIQGMSWIILITSIPLPLFASPNIKSRLFLIALSLSSPFILLSGSYEPLFYLTLFCHFLTFLNLAFSWTDRSFLYASPYSFGTVKMFYLAFIALFYYFLSFFGTGNSASINSFDPMWTAPFVTVFSPFLMTTLLIFKIIIPFLLTTSFLRAVCTLSGVEFRKFLCAVLVFSDILGLNFLFLVKNEGSWLEIGMSLSHFVITQATCLFVTILYHLCGVYTCFSALKKLKM